MLPSRHIVASLPLAAGVGLLTESLLAGLLCFASGVLIDIDHFVEYAIHYWGLPGFSLKLKTVYPACKKWSNAEGLKEIKRLYLVFHIGEITILLWIFFVFSANIYLLGLALGYTGHLIMDAGTNVLKPSAYFMLSRIRNSFSTIKLLKDS